MDNYTDKIPISLLIAPGHPKVYGREDREHVSLDESHQYFQKCEKHGEQHRKHRYPVPGVYVHVPENKDQA